jgi:N-hydroxyarylamine O-acetyltransferase
VDARRLLDHIGFVREPAAGAADLARLQRAHLRRVPFETLDCLLGNPVTVEPQDAYRKVVEQGRGGYCFELNGLFGWLLEQLGFEVTRLAARPLLSDGRLAPPFAHLALLVPADGRRRLVDVGFGFPWMVAPLDVDERGEQVIDGRRYVVRDDGDALVAQELGVSEPNGYRFTLEPQPRSAFADRCRSYSTDPESPFVRSAPVVRQAGDGWAKVTRQRVTVERGGRLVADREITSADDWRAELERHFGLVVDGREVRAVHAPPPGAAAPA